MAIVLHLIYVSVALVGLGLAVQSLTAKKLTNVQTMANVSDLTSAIVLMDIRATIVMLLLTAVLLGIAVKTDFAYLTRNWKVFASKRVLIMVIIIIINNQVGVRTHFVSGGGVGGGRRLDNWATFYIFYHSHKAIFRKVLDK